MLSFQVETWADLVRDYQEIIKEHFDELALNKEEMPLGFDDEIYFGFERLGYLLVLTARREQKLCGYFVAVILSHHPHNKLGGRVATTDMFYLAKDQRHGGAGAKLLLFAKSELKRRGVKDASISTKVHFENAQLMDLIWGKPTDIVRRIIL